MRRAASFSLTGGFEDGALSTAIGPSYNANHKSERNGSEKIKATGKHHQHRFVHRCRYLYEVMRESTSYVRAQLLLCETFG